MSGTHVGIIGNVAVPGAALKAEIQQVLDDITSRGPFPPLVLHSRGQGSDKAARDHVCSLSNWQVKDDAEPNSEIAEACHILIVIAPGRESGPLQGPVDVWSLVKKARASGRTIIHIPIVMRSPETAGQPAPLDQETPFQPAKDSLAWALIRGREDREAGKASSKYTHFRDVYGLPESPESLKLWLEYRKAAGAPPHSKKKRGGIAPPAISGGSQPRRKKKNTFRETPMPRSRPDPSGAVPLKARTAALLRTINPPDPDVWR